MRNNTHTTAARLAAACLLVVSIASPALAGDEIDVQVTAIRGTNSDSTVSPELKSVEAELKKQFKVTGFKHLRRSNGKASDGKPFVAELVETYKATVTAVERKDKRITLKLDITKDTPAPKDDEKGKDEKGKKDGDGKGEKGGGKGEKGGEGKGRDKKDDKKAPGSVTSVKLTIDAGKSQFVSVTYPGAPDDLLIIAVSAK
jgi:hypothetical protein